MRGFITSSCSSIVILMRVSARLCSNRSLTLGFHRVSLASVNQRAFRKKRFPHTDADDLRLQLRMHTSVRHLVPKGASVRSSQARLRNWIQMPHMKSQASLINSLPSYLSTELADRDELNSKTGLQTVDWLPAFRNDPANEPVLTAGAMLSNDAKLPPDHIFSAFLKVGLLQDMLCTFNQERREFSSIITLGKNVCGHPTIVHGGLTAAIVDETLGGLNYLMKKHGMLDPGPAFTVHMVMDWKKPIPASSHIICTASLDSIEGRKTWVRATVKDRPDGVEYAAGRALFVIPKKHPLNTAADGNAEEDRAHAAGERAQTESGVERQIAS